MKALDLRGLSPAPVTPFTLDGAVDFAAIQRLGSWLGSIDGVKSLVVLGHAGEGTFMTQDEQARVIRAFIESTNGRIPVIAGITLEGTKVAAEEAKRAVAAGAAAGLVYPSHGWLRFGYQKGAPQDRYRAIYEESGLPLILFQYPDATKATYNLETQLEIAAQPGVFAMKNGVRNMKRWDTEIPVIRRERPNLQILTCHDEYLLHTMFDVDGALVGYGGIAPEPLIEMIAAGKAKDYAKARALHDRLLPVTSNVYHRGSHMEGSVALKWALVARGILDHATVRPPLLPLAEGAQGEIAAAMKSAGLGKVVARRTALRRAGELTAGCGEQTAERVSLRRKYDKGGEHVMTAIVADGAALHGAAQCPTGGSPRAASGHAQVDAHPRHRGHRHFLRRFHGAGDRVRDAEPVIRMEAYADRGRLDPLGRLCRSAVRRRDLRVAG